MSQPFRLVIVGGVAGGASAAARARRLSESVEILMVERGPHISFANCGLPYHVGGAIPDRSRLLLQTPASLGGRFNLDIRVDTEAVAIDREAREILIRDLKTGQETRERYDALLLSPGAAPIRPALPGFDLPKVLTLRNIPDMDRVLEVLGQGRLGRALVVGGGYIGLEMAEALRERGVAVVLAELGDQVMAPLDPEMAMPLHDELRTHGVDLRLGTSVTGFREGEALEAQLSSGETLAVDFALLAVGVRPEVALAREAGLTLGPRGGIQVDDQMRTSDPAIWAVGDAVEVQDFVGGVPVLVPLAGPANRQGRIAAEVILGRDSRYRATQGTGIVKLFGLTAATTGLSEKALARLGRPFRKVYLFPGSHAGYYPGAHPISLKVLFAPDTGRLLGAQAVGVDGVDKRMDVLAMALRAGLTVFDLEDQELSYAPPYGSAKDPVNFAGMVATNVLRGDVALWEPEELPLGPEQVLLDVRSAAEHAAGSLPGATLLPVDDLRAQLDRLDRDREYLVHCQVGLRGYLACRILTQHGFRARNLSGGYRRWQLWQGTAQASDLAHEVQSEERG